MYYVSSGLRDWDVECSTLLLYGSGFWNAGDSTFLNVVYGNLCINPSTGPFKYHPKP